MNLRALALCILLLTAGTAGALSPDEILADPVLEQRARDISGGLRCLVCQNQSIDDSDADLAKDLRVLVRERLVLGDTNQQVEQYVVDRYGEYVLLNPRWGAHTLLLWTAAPLLLLAGLFGIVRARRNNAVSTDTAMTAEERQALADLSRDTERR